MGLRQTVQKAVKAGLKATGNIRQTLTLTGSIGTFSALTGWSTTTTTLTVKGILDKYDAKQIDGTIIKPNDQMAIIAQLEMPSMKPNRNTKLTDEDGITWNVQDVQQDAAKASWVLQIRKP